MEYVHGKRGPRHGPGPRDYGEPLAYRFSLSNLGRWLPIERSTELAAEATAPPERRGGRSPEFSLPVAPEH